MVGILLNSSSERQNSNELQPARWLERLTTRVRSGPVIILTGSRLLKRMQGAVSYGFQLGMDVTDELKGNQ